jgi:hypothetical protein
MPWSQLPIPCYSHRCHGGGSYVEALEVSDLVAVLEEWEGMQGVRVESLSRNIDKER